MEEYALGMGIGALAIYACVQVFTRYALNFSFTSWEEFGRSGHGGRGPCSSWPRS